MITSFNLGYLSSDTAKVLTKHYVIEPILQLETVANIPLPSR